MTHLDEQGLRSQGLRKSNFPGKTIIPADATLDFVSGKTNFKIPIADFLTALGVTGSIIQVGDSGDVPVLDDQGSVKGIRNISPGFGIAALIDAQNSLEISTDFTFNEIGTTLVDDPDASAAIFRSLIAGPGISISSVPGQIQITSTVLPASTKTVVVAQKSDLPAPVAGIITLAANTHYLFVDDVSVGTDRFILNSNVISASDSTIIKLTYTGTGDMFTAVGGNNVFSQIDLSFANGALGNIDGLGVGLLIMKNITISAAKSLGTLKDLRGTIIRNITTDPIATDGFLFTGTHGSFFCVENLINIAGGTLFDLGTATFNAFSYVNSVFVPTGGATMLSGLASSGNINTGSLGTIQNIQQVGTGTPLAGITSDDAQWQFSLNSDIADTRPDALLSFNTPTPTVIPGANTPVLITGTWIIERKSQFTLTAGGRATYDGVKDAVLAVSAQATIEPVSGANKDIEIHLAVNGTVVTNANTPNKVSSGDPKNTSVMWQIKFEPGDFVELFVENKSDGINLQVNKATLRVN